MKEDKCKNYNGSFDKELSDKYVDLLRIIHINDYCEEEGHIDADFHICNLLIELGYKDVVKEYDKISKWYA